MLFLLKILCRSKNVIAKLKQERKICVWSKLLQETLKRLVRGGESVWREHMLQNSTCKMILSEMGFDSKSRQERGREREKKWKWEEYE